MSEKYFADSGSGEKILETKEQFNFESALELIDFERIRSIFREKLEVLGLESAEMSFVEKEKVREISFVTNISPFLGMYYLKGRDIAINTRAVADRERRQTESDYFFSSNSFWKKVSEEPKRNRKLFEALFLSVVCHEETHAVSHRECPEWNSVKGASFVKKQERFLGIQNVPQYLIGEKSFTLGKDQRAFLLFNEAITDKIGEEIFYAYQMRDKEDRNQDDAKGEKYFPGYKKGRFLVETVLEKIAEECDIEKEIVWKFLQRGFFLNETLDGDFVKRLFGQIAPPHLLSDIRHSGGGFLDLPSLALAVTKIRRRKWSEKDKKRIRRWFKEGETRKKPNDFEKRSY